tara:strand:- start:1161 stop:2057 length:897 start_codon:yes stop_codon:yes gene_type:complete
MIKHLVINGGGPTGWISYGALKCLFEKKFIHINNIKSIYGTSAGAIIAVIISLKYDWITLEDYFLKRPWDKVLKIEPDHFFEMYYNKGLFQFNLVKEVLTPLLTAKDLSENITLKEYYEYNNIDLHCFTVELNSFQKIDLNHNTYPDLPLIKALEMTSAYPILFKPIIDDDKCYIDGGLIDNYPINECLENQNCDEKEILGIKNKWSSINSNINNEMNLFQYLQTSFGKIVEFIQKNNTSSKTIHYELKCLCNKNLLDYTKWLEYMTKKEKIEELMEEGKEYAELFLNYENELSQSTI